MLSVGSSAKPCQRLCHVTDQQQWDRAHLVRKHEYREEVQRETQNLKWTRYFPLVNPHAVSMSHTADEDNTVHFMSAAPTLSQDTHCHTQVHLLTLMYS